MIDIRDIQHVDTRSWTCEACQDHEYHYVGCPDADLWLTIGISEDYLAFPCPDPATGLNYLEMIRKFVLIFGRGWQELIDGGCTLQYIVLGQALEDDEFIDSLGESDLFDLVSRAKKQHKMESILNRAEEYTRPPNVIYPFFDGAYFTSN